MNFEFNDIENEFLKIITKNALKQNTRVFFVGGMIRDNLLKINSKDIDLIVLGNAIEFVKTLPCEIKIKSVHEDFYTAKVEYKGLKVDIASTRSESYPYSGCLPVINKVGVDLLTDVKRRDFSVNSMYCELGLVDNLLTYELVDIVRGVYALKNKLLFVLHEKSYIDDPSRIIRGVGFKCRFGFEFSDRDKNLIKNYLNNIDRTKMSHDRIFSVFKKVFLYKKSFEIFSEIIKERYYKILFDDDLNINLDFVKEVVDTFCLSNEDEAAFYLSIMENKPVEVQKLKENIEIYNFFSKFAASNLAYYFYKTSDLNVLKYNKIKNIKVLINGQNLIGLGYRQGKVFGEILSSLLTAKLNNSLLFETLEDEIAWVRTHYPVV